MPTKIKIAFSDEYILSLPQNHKFPIDKYRLIPLQLLSEGLISNANIFSPGFADKSIIELTHTREYVEKVLSVNLSEKEVRKIGFPQSKDLVEREFIISNGTVKGALYALETGVSLNVAGGTHHAYSDRGEGFCIFNDVAVASNYLLSRKYVTRILIVDLDVHQGNGTAKIFENNSDVFTFSMHGESNYPLHKEKSDLDIPLQSKTNDDVYLKILHETLPHLIKLVNPEFIFYISGVDVLETDKWGKLGMTIQGSKQRDEFVLNQAKKNLIPIMVSMGGGYSPNINDIVTAHCNTFRSAFEIFS